jgi:hypothetical protein
MRDVVIRPGDRLTRADQIPGRLPSAAGVRRIDHSTRSRQCTGTSQVRQPKGFRQMFASRVSLRPSDVVIRAAIVALTLATGYIHLTLGGLLFTLNAVGYFVAAVAMIAPLALAVRFRWIVRVGLIGYAATAIVAWAVMGPYFTTAYVAKAIEIALIVLLAIDFARHDGNPIALVRRELAVVVGLITRRSGTAGAGA